MNRADFINRLAELLADVSPAERDEAIQYYNDYFDDAGVENEQSVIASLGTPEQLARSIRTGLADGGNIGEFTEKGFSGYETPKNDEVLDLNRTQTGQNTDNGWQGGQGQNENYSKEPEKKGLSGGMIALIVVLCIFASPILLGVGGGLLGCVIGLFGGLFGTIVGIGAASVALFIVGVCLFVYGFALIFGTPLGGLCMMGGGMICVSVGMLLLWLTVITCGVLIPAIIRGIVSLCQKIFHRGGATA